MCLIDLVGSNKELSIKNPENSLNTIKKDYMIDKIEIDKLTHKIIGYAMKVHTILGNGL